MIACWKCILKQNKKSYKQFETISFPVLTYTSHKTVPRSSKSNRINILGRKTNLFVDLLITVPTNQNQQSPPLPGRADPSLNRDFDFPRNFRLCAPFPLWITFYITAFVLHMLVLKTRSCKSLFLGRGSLTSTWLLASARVLGQGSASKILNLCVRFMFLVNLNLLPPLFVTIFEEVSFNVLAFSKKNSFPFHLMLLQLYSIH